MMEEKYPNDVRQLLKEPDLILEVPGSDIATENWLSAKIFFVAFLSLSTHLPGR